MPQRKDKNSLGRGIIRSRFNGRLRPQDNDTRLFVPDTVDESTNMQSVTQENDLDAFMRTAEMAGTDFKAERLDTIQVLLPQSGNPYIPSEDQEKKMKTKMDHYKERLTIPRRPYWDETTTPDELKKAENISFLEWRRGLAELEEELEMILTPFERNLEVWRQLWRVIERSQIVVQIVDARNPLFFRCLDMENYVTEVDEEKQNVLLINKADFLSEKQRQAWANYFTQEKNIKFAFFSAVQDDDEDEAPLNDLQIKNLNLFDSSSDVTKVLSPRQLISFLNTFHDPKLRDKTTIGLVGYPNVGKSSTINKLMGQKLVTVSATPGKTKHFQTLLLSEIITLCDCPGLVFPSFAVTKAEMVVNGVLPIDQLRESTGPAHIVSHRIPRYFLEWYYGIHLPQPGEGEDPNRSPTGSELLIAYAIVRGFRKSGQGNPDESRAARLILKDYVNGKLIYCEAPPGTDPHEFNEETYAENGHKYQEALKAREKYLERKEDITYETAPISMDDDKVVNARIKKKSLSAGVVYSNRVTSFPHLTGYNDQIQEEDKKGHKNGKRRVKDRSWRA